MVLLDEALGGVDQPTTEELFDLFRTLAADGTTLLVSTHDLALARRRFDRCLAVNGTLRADGDPSDVLSVDALETIFGSGIPGSADPSGQLDSQTEGSSAVAD